MRKNLNVIAAYSIMMGLIILVGIFQSWNIALSIFNLCLISAVMTMGANIQWGYAGLINFGIMGYTALGGLAAVLVSVPPVQEAWQAGGFNMILCAFMIIYMVFSIRFIMKKYRQSKKRSYGITAIIIVGLVLLRLISAPEVIVKSVLLPSIFSPVPKVIPTFAGIITYEVAVKLIFPPVFINLFRVNYFYSIFIFFFNNLLYSEIPLAKFIIKVMA